MTENEPPLVKEQKEETIRKESAIDKSAIEESVKKGTNKIGVYLCRCGGNIADVVDLQAVTDKLKETRML